ncbi:hypothetical protein N7489_006307 [Penicillium chrysogenum]|uniref:Uncharacterized protein n=1 Tax=Penicillium chrysogenum TaxID=5076 RepID=A0ABQ8W4N2_PENCH|nr:uncharacterized protein N7489_006307 [Penicillium chrysogenum]KAJ5236216.1 hypothetical protein N7489_006307 [Penicillium chrysogenum]KAJ5255120.1 hypothetical protein N7505_010271 [Penicillium chrysogenum]KAJ5276155.1 hypothetical protein N7524_002308 [Penicillium chrysogenum]KAJ6153082.1 hypothetical protein N7497_007401 [Penicillium chrysogenum]
MIECRFQRTIEQSVGVGVLPVNFLQDLPASRTSEGDLQFTDAPGRHVKTTPVEEIVAKNGFRLI